MDNLKIPYGVDGSGELISAVSATKGSEYSCPCCGMKLIHRAGEVRVKHFAHPPASNCSLESVLHITAKRLVYAEILKNAAGEEGICLADCCQNCGVEFSTRVPANTFTNAGMEVGVGDYICDVVGYQENTVRLAIEILNTHKVDAKKAANLAVYWLELKAEDVINNSLKWSPTQANLKESYCMSCKDHIKHVVAVADKYGINRALYSAVKNPSKHAYIADIEVCFKCNQEIPVFWWQGVPFCEFEPPNPKPKTIKYRYSKKYGGSYWANTCADCNVIQGDNFLYIFNSARFKGMPMSNLVQDKHAGVKVVSGSTAVSEFMKVVNRNF
ncbi:competence protein CoiA family protein [Oceanisphaera ostreae]|uniref:Competence protein CoiA family protein n=1 Tax=Oceanisphaera ostreae TaxID=914151 RepID=A0ABW3KEP9_9GAMM